MSSNLSSGLVEPSFFSQSSHLPPPFPFQVSQRPISPFSSQFPQSPPFVGNSIPMYSPNPIASQGPAAVPNPIVSGQTNSADDTRRKADGQPWRYRGYPALCTWMASDDDFFVVRRFGKLAARVVLFKQDRIVELEQKLQIEDRLCREAEKAFADSGTFRNDPRPGRRAIMDQLSDELERYQRFLLDHSSLKTCPEATESQVRNVKTWLKNSNGAIADEETQFIEQNGDLIPVVPKNKTPMRRFLDRFDITKKIPCFRNRKLNKQLYHQEDFESQTTIYNKSRELTNS